MEDRDAARLPRLPHRGPAGDVFLPPDWTRLIGLALLWVAAVLTLITGYDYMKASIRHLVEEDSAA